VNDKKAPDPIGSGLDDANPLLKRAAENNVFLFPGMNVATVCAGELLLFHLRSGPALFIDGLAGIDKA